MKSSLRAGRACRESAETRRRISPFRAGPDFFIRQWKASGSNRRGDKHQQQKARHILLFQRFWHIKPIRAVASFEMPQSSTTLRLFDPSWARSPSAKRLSWTQHRLRYLRQQAPRLSGSATMDRHMATLQELWRWASRRGHCGGKTLRRVSNQAQAGRQCEPYLAWELDELERLLAHHRGAIAIVPRSCRS